ncbi:MAG: reprolysin-like metallopeptidase, partial [Planctomycetota bacterium]
MRSTLISALVASLGLTSLVAAQEASSISAGAVPVWRAGALTAPPEVDAAEARWRSVDVSGAEWLATEAVRTVEFELFDGESMVVSMERRGSARPGSALWYGERAEGESVWLSYVDGAVAALVRHDGRVFRLRPDAGGTVLAELAPERFDGCATGETHRIGGAPLGGSAVGGGSFGAAGGATALESFSGSDLEEVDVLVGYTASAKNSSGGTNGMLAQIDLMIASTNDAYDRCDAGLYVRLVHAYEVDYAESGSASTDLSRWRSKTDGNMDEVHALRDAFGADACALITNFGGACGVAYLMTNVSQGFQSSAFSVTIRSCAVGNLTFAHELGHNFGCAHDDANAGNASKPYAYGYRTPNNQYRTVMAYSPGQRVPLFSSPLHTWAGFTMGTASGEDNARALTLNAPTIANWRPTVATSVDCNDNGVADAFEIAIGDGTDIDGDGALDQCDTIFGNTQTISFYTGGSQTLSLNAGAQYAGDFYILLGSLSGTDPGTSLLGAQLPLVSDAYFNLTLNQGGAGLISNGFGLLDANGAAEAVFSIPASPFSFGLLVTPANHAFLVFDETLN